VPGPGALHTYQAGPDFRVTRGWFRVTVTPAIWSPLRVPYRRPPRVRPTTVKPSSSTGAAMVASSVGGPARAGGSPCTRLRSAHGSRTRCEGCENNGIGKLVPGCGAVPRARNMHMTCDYIATREHASREGTWKPPLRPPCGAPSHAPLPPARKWPRSASRGRSS
jgi:hypothetical protein